MREVTLYHVSRRISPIALVTAFLAAAILGILAPSAAAAPVAPYLGPNVLVNQIPAYSGTTPSIVIGSNGEAYLAFQGWGGTTTQNDIFFTRSVNGRTWTAPIRVNNDAGAANQQEPSIALDAANNILIAWTDNRNGNNDIYFAKSTDGGLSFSSNVRVNEANPNAQTQPDLAVDHANPNLVHVVWTDSRSSANGPDIFYANSTDGGLSFNLNLRVNNDSTSVEQGQPQIAVAPNRDVYVVWSDPRNAARGRDIYFSKSSDRGVTWSPNIPVNDDPVANVAQQDPTIAVSEDGTIFVAWTDFRTANTGADIWAARSTNGGSSFTANVKVNDDVTPLPQATPSVATAAGTVELAWTDTRTVGSTNWDVYSASSPDGISWSVNRKVNDDTGASYQAIPTVAVDATRDVFIAWLDTRSSGADIYASVLDRVAPVAAAGSAMTIDQGGSVSFDAGASTDNLGIAASTWDFGDDTLGAGPTATHIYASPGAYVATLTVWDYSGNSGTSNRLITVRDTLAPTPRGGGDRAVEEGQPLFFDASASTDNVGVAAVRWDFGDGSNATTATASHVYAKPGTYTARLTVTDAAGNSGTTTFTVTVRPSALLPLIYILGAGVGILAVAVALLGWRLARIGSALERRPAGSTSGRGSRSAESDPLDMTFPPAPPKAP